MRIEGVELERLDALEALLADFPQLNLVLFTPDANYILGQEINAQAKKDAEIEFSTIYHTDLASFKRQDIPVLVPIFMGETAILDDGFVLIHLFFFQSKAHPDAGHGSK